ncbi:Alpha/Beta hydrolase protein [Xylogone sp. PMI_703]|nr:Alpha/Beta hydrolase protein [Xylogone sp. PMI_703]
MEGSQGVYAPISEKVFTIAGILTSVYGLDELPADCKSVSCLWLLHPRLQIRQYMTSVASDCIHGWNQSRPVDSKVGLIAVAFDQRNHGTREVMPLANQAWKEGNPLHAQDMFSIFQGTAMDTSLLMDHLGSYILYAPDDPPIDYHMAMGISLGGHSTWQLFFNEPRISTAIVIIGCPDYMRLMSDRARLSKLQTYTADQGSTFLGSKDFPRALISSVKKWDPRGILFGTSEVNPSPSHDEQTHLRGTLDSKIKGKQVLVCSGREDKLVPYHNSEPFLKFLKNATSTWYQDGKVYVEDNIYPGVGHAYSDGMKQDTVRFISDILAGKSSKSASKI